MFTYLGPRIIPKLMSFRFTVLDLDKNTGCLTPIGPEWQTGTAVVGITSAAEVEMRVQDPDTRKALRDYEECERAYIRLWFGSGAWSNDYYVCDRSETDESGVLLGFHRVDAGIARECVLV